ncbi:hypothetical protein [Sphingomonas lenta]|nr:hypothetical protein [Sphingomonas lenta]
MRSFKNSFAQQFVGGFVLGAVGLLAFQPAEATRNIAERFAVSVPAQR